MKRFIVELYDEEDDCWFEYNSLYDYSKALIMYKMVKKSLPAQDIRLVQILEIERKKNNV